LNTSELSDYCLEGLDILLGVHGTGVDVEIGVNLDRRDVNVVSTRRNKQRGSNISSNPWSSAAGPSTRLNIAIMSVLARILEKGYSYR